MQPISMCATSRLRVNLSVLESKFRKTCLRRAGSASQAAKSPTVTSTSRPSRSGCNSSRHSRDQVSGPYPLLFGRLAAEGRKREQVVH